MKKLLIILLSLLSLSAFAQQKTVAVLDPICRDNSVNAFFQSIVRGTMESAVSSSDEYIAYDRTAFDKIMQEQKFQRSGAVNDSQIKRLGELAGVDYVLVTEVSAYEGYMNVIVKILNVETGQSTKSKSELMEMTPPSVQNTCRGLAQQVFGFIDFGNGIHKGELLLVEGKYVGEIQYGKPHGKGKLIYKDSDEKKRLSYEGDWKEGIRYGYGSLEWKDGRKYEGEWVNGDLEGDGTYWADGNIYVGNWKEGVVSGQGIYYFSDGSRYEGNFENGRRNGYGTYYGADGNKYVGNWKEGVVSGQGIYYFSDGSRYEGSFKDNDINGYGTFYYADGTKHVGNFKNGIRHGVGVYYGDSGRIEGTWENGSLNGAILFYGNDGSQEKGNYVNGQQDGEWILIESNGTRTTAIFSNGNLIRAWH